MIRVASGAFLDIGEEIANRTSGSADIAVGDGQDLFDQVHHRWVDVGGGGGGEVVEVGEILEVLRFDSVAVKRLATVIVFVNIIKTTYILMASILSLSLLLDLESS